MRSFIRCAALTAAALVPVVTVMAEEAEAPPKPLESSLALGVTYNDGNTDNLMVNFGLGLDYRPDDIQLLRLAVDVAYGEEEGNKTTDNSKAQLDYQYLLNERLYAALNSSYTTDDIADLDYRWVISPGLGYYVMKAEEVFMTVEAGPAYISEKKGDVSDDDFALRLAQRYERTMKTSAKFWQSAEYLPRFDDFDLYILNVEIGVEAPISQSLGVRLVARNTYDSNPAPDRERNDLSIIGALSYALF